MRKTFRRFKEPVGASARIEPYRAAISKVPGVAKVRAVIREHRSINERFEFTITLFTDFKEREMRQTVVDDVDAILREPEFVPTSRLLTSKENGFVIVVQRQEKLRFR